MAKNEIAGYHYAKGDNLPANMLNLSKKERIEALKWYEEHTPDKDSSRYLKDRKRLEKALHSAAKKKLGDKVKLKHPLYFRIDLKNKVWGGKSGKVYKIPKDLLDKSTFTPGDSFDLFRGHKKDWGKITLKDLKSAANRDVMDLKEVIKKRDKIKLRERKHGNYIEGQLWVPHGDLEKVSERMTFPSMYKKPILSGSKNTTIRISDEIGKYKVGKTYSAFGKKIKILSAKKMKASGLSGAGIPKRSINSIMKNNSLSKSDQVEVIKFEKTAAFSSIDDIRKTLKDVGIDPNSKSYVLHGSAPMLAHGLRDEIHDLDVMVSPRLFNKLKEKAKLSKTKFGDRRVSFDSSNIGKFTDWDSQDVEIFKSWKKRDSNLKAMLKDSERVDGVNFGSIEELLDWKRSANRKKDKPDIRKIDKYLKRKGKSMDKQAHFLVGGNSSENIAKARKLAKNKGSIRWLDELEGKAPGWGSPSNLDIAEKRMKTMNKQAFLFSKKKKKVKEYSPGKEWDDRLKSIRDLRAKVEAGAPLDNTSKHIGSGVIFVNPNKGKSMNKQALLEETYRSAFEDELEKIAGPTTGGVAFSIHKRIKRSKAIPEDLKKQYINITNKKARQLSLSENKAQARQPFFTLKERKANPELNKQISSRFKQLKKLKSKKISKGAIKVVKSLLKS